MNISNWATLVLPSTIAPAWRSRATCFSSAAARVLLRAGSPNVDGVPAGSRPSLMVTGAPPCTIARLLRMFVPSMATTLRKRAPRPHGPCGLFLGALLARTPRRSPGAGRGLGEGAGEGVGGAAALGLAIRPGRRGIGAAL